MNEEALPIEMRQEVSPGGIVRGESIKTFDQVLPDMVAYRPEPWRFLRLMRLYGIALGIASGEFGDAEASKLEGAVMRLEDWKGDLVARWRSQADLDRFSSAFDRAVRFEREEEIVHEVGLPEGADS